MVVLVILLVAAGVCIGTLSYNLYKWKKAYTVSTDGLAAHLKDAQAKLEDLDVWKKACWDAEKRFQDTLNYSEGIYTQVLSLQRELAKVINQKKSSEVRTGLIAEQMAPFLDTFPYNPKQAHFLGKPIDFIVFSDDGIHFVEVKSGESKLTDAQRKIKKDIQENRVTFETFRINGD